MIILIALATFVFTLVGGLFALRFKDKSHLILGFSAGAVVAVAFFDLLPEAIELGEGFYDVDAIALMAALGFLGYLILDRVIFIHGHSHEDVHDHGQVEDGDKGRGILGASSLTVHGFLDGIAVGLAFQVSAAVGAVVAIAILAHKFSDGLITVNLILKNMGDRKQALGWLLAGALAPVLGVSSTLVFSLPPQSLAVIMAVFCGFFLYVGASDLIPESHHAHPKFLTTVMTLLGAGVLYAVIAVAQL